MTTDDLPELAHLSAVLSPAGRSYAAAIAGNLPEAARTLVQRYLIQAGQWAGVPLKVDEVHAGVALVLRTIHDREADDANVRRLERAWARGDGDAMHEAEVFIAKVRWLLGSTDIH